MKKKGVLLFSVLFLMLSVHGSAQEEFAPDEGQRTTGRQQYIVGLGISFGSFNGANLKLLLSQGFDFEMGAGWTIGPAGGFQVYADGHFNWLTFSGSTTDWRFFTGLGARLNVAGTAGFRVGGRVPLGFEVFFRNSGLGLYCKITPTLDLVTELDFNWYGEAGIRWLF